VLSVIRALIAYTVRTIISTHIEEFQVDVSKPVSDELVVRLHDWSIRMQANMDLGLVQSERSPKQRKDCENEHRSAIEEELVTLIGRSRISLSYVVSYTIICPEWIPKDPQYVRQRTAAFE
jgi:hypothetical protein